MVPWGPTWALTIGRFVRFAIIGKVATSRLLWRIQNGMPISITTELSMTSTSKIWHHSINTWLRTQHRILWYSRVILTSHHGSFIAHIMSGITFKSGISLHAMPMLPSPGSVISPIACLLQCRSGTNVSQWEPPVPEAVMPQLTAVMPQLAIALLRTRSCLFESWAGIDSLPCIVRTVGYFLRPCSAHDLHGNIGLSSTAGLWFSVVP